MDAPKTTRKPTPPDSPLIESMAAEDDFSATLLEVAKRFGVKMTPVAAPENNPYAMSAEQAAEIAVQAGIITRSGKLKFPFK